MELLKSMVADLGYLISNAREFGLWTIPEDIEYMLDNIRESKGR